MLPEPTEDDDVPAFFDFFLACILPVVVAYFLLRKCHGRSNKRETQLAPQRTEDALASEITAYLFSLPTSLTKSADVCITKNVYGPVENKNVCAPVKIKNACAVCARPGPFRCKLCKSAHYCLNFLLFVPSWPRELMMSTVSDSDFSYSDVVRGNADVTYPVNARQPTICAPETGNRKNASITFGIPDTGANLTSDMIGSCSGTNSFMKQEGTYASTTKPLQRTLSYGITIEHKALENLLIDGRAKPMMLSYEVLKDITNNFSEVIGSGGSGEVYMGVLENGNVAVKKLYNTEAFTEKQFEDELTCLIRVEHKNIVRLLGYCSDIQQKVVEYGGRLVLADIRRRFLCLEYAPNKSLADYLKDESHGHDWDTRYQFIEGICRGLHYLHKKESITHMDLKPGNILLDANMVPKITDFGLSRRFSGAESRIITKHLCGSLGYIAPELLERGEISLKSDIFSLGIIIRNILRGSTSLSDFENWYESLDVDCPRFKRCFEIAQLCVNYDPRKRPTMDCIMCMLNAKEKAFQEASPVTGQ